ncbi:MAG: DNA translocase FtsK [Pseudobdellovibrionaceae bacterium]
MNPILKKFRQDISAVVFLGAGLFVSLSLYSYTPSDPSLNSIGQGLLVKNYCGLVGSFLADIFYQGFGLTSWLSVVGLLSLSLGAFQGQKLSLKNLRFLWAGLLILTASGLLAMYFPETRIFKDQILLGGLIGWAIAKVLTGILNFAGAAVLLWSAVTILVVFYSEKTLAELTRFPVARLARFKNEFLPLVFKWFQQLFKAENKKTKMKIEEKEEAKKPLFKLKPITIEEPKTQDPDEEQFSFETPEYEESPADPNEDPAVQKKRKVVLKAKVVRKVENWQMPKLSLLEDPPATRIKVDEKELRRKAEVLTDKLAQFNVNGQVVAAKPGPAVTLFEFKPEADVRVNTIENFDQDLSLALASESVRIIAPIPGRDVVGIETANSQRETVYLKDLLAEEAFWDEQVKLPVALGRQVNGDPKIVDLRKMPHLLVAGTTGSGKSVFTVSTLVGMIFKHSPKTLKLILIDPKQVDLAAFNSIPHLIMPPIFEPKKAVGALRWAVREMEKRYLSMRKFGARQLEEYNERVSKLSAEDISLHEKTNEEYEQQAATKSQKYYYQELPYIVIVCEEFADLMTVDKSNVEQVVVRLAQMARACGIHLMLAMQSPRKEVVTGLIKTNIPGRISFKVASKMDSRIILDESGAETLLARGDMLFLSPGVAKPMRHHGPWLSEAEISGLAKFWSDQGEPEFDLGAIKAIDGSGGGNDLGGGMGDEGDTDYDEMWDQVVSDISQMKTVSASLLQRKYNFGYPRAGRIIEMLERDGIIGPAK